MNNDAGKISFESGLDLTGLDRDIKAAQDRFRELNGNVQKECTGIDGSIRNIGASIAAVFTVQKAGEFIKKMVAVRGEIESLEKSFGILAGTVQGKKLFEEIKDFAVKTPMTMPALAKGAQTLLAFNYEAEKVMPILRAIGDISMGNEQKFNSLVLAFSQMSSTGKLMGQDLLQMINAGFNPLAVISEQTGKSIGELKEDMAAGAISSEMITKAFMDATSEGGKFNGMLEQQSKGIEGSLSNLEGAIQDMFNELGEKSQGVITSSIQNVTALVQNYEKVGRMIAGFIAIYGTYRAALITLNAIKKASIAINSGWTASELLHYKALVIVEKAQKLLNATMLKNPYVLVATAVVSLAAMVWALRDSLSAAEKAQKKYNETKEEALQKEKEHSDAIQGLIDKVRDETAVMAEREAALLSLKNEYPDIFNKYDIEKLKLADLLEIKKQINQEDYKRKRAAAKQEYLDFSKNIHWDTKGNNNTLSKLRDEQLATRNLMREDYTKDSVAEFITTLKNKSQEELDNILQTALGASEGLNGFQLDDNMNVIKDRLVNSSNLDKVSIEGDNLTTIIDAINKEISYRNPINTPTYAVDYEKARKEWETAKKELQAIEKDKDNFTTKQYEDAKSREENAKKRYSELGGDVSEKTKSTSEDRTAEEMKNAARERMALEKNLYFQEQQNRINLEADERKRKTQQMALDHEKELYNLEQQKQSAIEAEIERQKAIFEAKENARVANDKNHIKKAFTEDDIDNTLISTIESQYATLEEQTKKLHRQSEAEMWRSEFESMRDYLKDYGTFQQQKLAIAEEYAEKIRNASSEGEKLSLEHERDSKLSSIEANALKANIDWTAVFGEFGGMFTEITRPILEDAKKYIGTKEFKNADHASQQALINAIQSIGGVEKVDFEKLGEDIKTYQKAMQNLRRAQNEYESTFNELTQAQKDYEEAISTGTKEEQEAAAIALRTAQTNEAAASQNIQTLQDYATEAQNTMVQTANTLKQSMDGVVSGLQKMASGSLSGAFEGFKEIADSASNISGKIGEAFEKVSDKLESVPIIGWIISIIDIFKDGLSIVVGGLLDAIFNAVTGILDDILSGEFFITLGESLFNGIKEILKSITTMGGLFDWWGDGDNIDEIIDRYEVLNRSVDEYGKKANESFGTGKKAAIEQQIALKQLQIELLKTAIAQEEQKKDPDDDKIKEWEDEIYLLEGEIDDLGDAAVDAIFGESISTAIENFTSAITDAWANAGNASQKAKDVVKNMLKQMISESIKAMIQSSGALEQIRTKMEEFFLDGIISASEQAILEGMAEDLANEIENKYGWADDLFANDSEFSQDSTKKGFQAMSQESADELNGRFTAIQIDTSNIKSLCDSILINTQFITNTIVAMRQNIDEIKNLSLLALDYLEAISKNTYELYEMNDRLGKIEQNTRNL
ncbi:MAG: tape measure protein [Bacteroidales bacterium]|nr:tape measure protein [Bacteroidales bacterium]